MRTLYLPTDGRRSPATEGILAQAVQSNVRVGPHSRTHAVTNVLVTERERLLGLIARSDVRPWRADVRQPGAVKEAGGAEDEALGPDELLYGVPDRWRLEKLRTYELLPHSAHTSGGDPTVPEQADRAVETPSGLIIQRGDQLWRLREDSPRARPLENGESGAFRPFSGAFCLVSMSEEEVRLLPRPGRLARELDFELKGLDVCLEEAGSYEIEILYTRAAPASEIAQDMGDYFLLYPEAVAGLRRLGSVRDAGTGDLIDHRPSPSIDGAVQFPSGREEGAQPVVYYQAAETIRHESRHGEEDPKVSFSHIAGDMLEYPSRQDITVRQTSDVLFNAPGPGPDDYPVDVSGRIGGDSGVGHPVVAALASEHHVLAASADRISLFEPAIGEVVLSQSVAGKRIRGVTWTPEGHLGIVTARENAFTVWALKDVRERRLGNWTPADRPT